jgi:hypothetical protein
MLRAFWALVCFSLNAYGLSIKVQSMALLGDLRTDRVSVYKAVKALNAPWRYELSSHLPRFTVCCFMGDVFGALFALPLVAWQLWRHFAKRQFEVDVTTILKPDEMARRVRVNKAELAAYAILTFYSTLGLVGMFCVWLLNETAVGRLMHGALKLVGGPVVRGEYVLGDD